MSFDPKSEYLIQNTTVRLNEFHAYADDYVTRPPYQRKTVWSVKKKQSLMDSLLRRYYVPDVVLREVRLDEKKTVQEVIDGQQRITTIQDFYNDGFPLPKSLVDVDPEFVGKRYSELDVDYKRFMDKLVIQVDLVKGIEKKEDPHHQFIATEIFWRLQQGESLNAMEIAHARLSSTVRNFLVKFADDITFDFERYAPIDENPHKLPFFQIMYRGNGRMEHLATLARMLLIEREGGYTDLKDSAIQSLIEETQVPNGIGNDDLEKTPAAQAVLANLKACYKVFEGSDDIADGRKCFILNREYFVLSYYMLVRHLRTYYAVDDQVYALIYDFIWNFHDRWRDSDHDNTSIQHFSVNRQQGAKELGERDMILRQAFFKFAKKQKMELKLKDGKRAFSEHERIKIFRRDKGLCQQCLAEGTSEFEAKISWDNYQADHVFPWSKGGATSIENGQVLCSSHNLSKGARV